MPPPFLKKSRRPPMKWMLSIRQAAGTIKRGTLSVLDASWVSMSHCKHPAPCLSLSYRLPLPPVRKRKTKSPVSPADTAAGWRVVSWRWRTIARCTTRARSGASTRSPSHWTSCRSPSRCFQSHITGGVHYFFLSFLSHAINIVLPFLSTRIEGAPELG
jgi:hypothetical protein